MEDKIKQAKCFLLDMDGTVYLSGVPIKGAEAAIERLRTRAKVLFLTNNTSVSREDYVHKLTHMGIKVTKEDIYTAGNATVDYLNKHYKNKSVYLLGTDALKREFKEGGIALVNDIGCDKAQKKPDLAVVGFDTTLNYVRISELCSLIRNGVPYLATHPDYNCPVTGGYIPDVGSFLALIEASCNIKPFIVCGKPNAPIAEGVAARVGVAPSQIMMVGDRLMTDMQFAINNGFGSCLVLSGEATKKDLIESGLKVDAVLSSIAEME